MKLTLILILVNVLVFIFIGGNRDYYIENLGFSISSIAEGRYYVFLTSLFLHANAVHLIANMIALLVLGGSVEKGGAFKYLTVYFLSGIAGTFSAFLPIFGYSSDTILVGASGAISGLIGYGIFVNPGSWVSFPWIIPIPFIVASAIYLLATLSLLFARTGVAYPAHLFGLLGGMLFGIIFGEKRIKRLILFILVFLLVIVLPAIIGALV